jgi:hypothetical protein
VDTQTRPKADPPLQIGGIVPVRITGALAYDLEGVPVI